MPSRAKAYKTLGAPKMLPMALDRVAPQTPNKIASPHRAMRRMTRGAASRVNGSAHWLSTMGITI